MIAMFKRELPSVDLGSKTLRVGLVLCATWLAAAGLGLFLRREVIQCQKEIETIHVAIENGWTAWVVDPSTRELIGLSRRNLAGAKAHLAGTRRCECVMLAVDPGQSLIEKRPMEWRYLVHLRTVMASGANLTAGDIDSLCSLPALRILDLGGTQVTDRQVSRLQVNIRLECVSLWGTEIGDVAVEALASLPSLNSLNLSETNVTDRSVVSISKSKTLRVLNLAETAVTDASVGELVGMSGLYILDIRRTRISDYGSKKVRDSLVESEVLVGK